MMRRVRRVAQRFAGLWLAALMTCGAEMGTAADVRVALFHDAGIDPQRSAHGALFQVLDETRGVAPAYVSKVAPDTLRDVDVLVLWLTKFRSEAAGRQANVLGEQEGAWLREWVENGGGLLCYNDSVGFERHASEPLFPSIARGIANPYPDRLGYARQSVVAGRHPVTRGLLPGDRFVLSYYDFIALEAGPRGTPLVFSVTDMPRGGMVSDPVVIVGTVGQGRYAANGMFSGLNDKDQPVRPESGEERLLVNAVLWLAGHDAAPEIPGVLPAADSRGDAGSNGRNRLVKGALLPERNLVLNPSCELIENGRPASWGVYLSTGKLEFGATKEQAHTGEHAAYVKVAGHRFSPERGVNQVGGALLTAQVDGYSGRRACRVRPNTVYHFSFWLKGDFPRVQVYGFGWTQEGESSSRHLLKSSLPPFEAAETWQRYEGSLTTGPDTVRLALAWHFAGRDDRNPIPAGAVFFVDDVELTQGERISSVEDLYERPLVHKTPTWQDTSGNPEVRMTRIAPATPIPMDPEYLAFPLYDPLPTGWERVDLGGLWKVKKCEGTKENPADDPGTQEQAWLVGFDDSSWAVRTVPGTWDSEDKAYPDGDISVTRGGAFHFTGVGWYRRKVTVPDIEPDRRALLHFRGVADRCDVFVNGHKVGLHVGGLVPFSFDVTSAVKAGDNLIALRVYDAERTSVHEIGGIWNSCYLTIGPNVYAKRVLLAPRIAESVLDMDAWLVNATDAAQNVALQAHVASYPTPLAQGPAYDDTIALGSVKLEPGVHRRTFRVPMKQPVLWTPRNPFLYLVEIEVAQADDLHAEAATCALSKTRFGFREFKSEGSYFLLNGKREWLRSTQYHARTFYQQPRIMIDNRANFMKRYLLAYRSFHANALYALAVVYPRPFYDLCDELGILVYDEWVCAGGRYPKNVPVESEAQLGQIDAWVYLHHNHPSIVMRSLGGELFERYKPDHVKVYKDYLDPLVKRVRSLDMQDRPVCPSSGRHLWVTGGKTDFCDLHFYPGGINGSWTDEPFLVRSVREAILSMYGREMPMIQNEFTGLGRHYTASADLKQMRKAGITAQGAWDKRGFIEIIQKEPAWWDYTRRLTGLHGLRRWLTGNQKWHRYGVATQKRSIKNALESVRRCGDLVQGVAPYLDGYEITEVLVDGKMLDNRAYGRGRLKGDLTERVFVASEAYEDLRRVYNPVFVCLDVFDKNVFAGGTLEATVFAINELQEDAGPWQVRAVIRRPDGSRVDDRTAAIGRVPSFKRVLAPYAFDLPAHWSTGFYRLELFLVEAGRVVSDNDYRFFVLGTDDRTAGLSTTRRVALYDIGEQVLGKDSVTTTHVLEDVGLDADPIRDFSNLDRYEVLIIGAWSVDPRLREAGSRIRRWVRQGGRLLAFEQVVTGAIPYLPRMQVVRNHANVLSEIIVPEHPVFEGLTFEHLDRWNGTLPDVPRTPGAVFAAALSPLNETVVASGCYDTPRTSTRGIRMTVSDVKVGHGMMLLNQLAATRRYGRDSVATRLVQNALRYIVSDEERYSTALPTFALGEVDMHQCGLVDLNPVGNVPVGEGAAAWLEGVPRGRFEFGGVTFDVPGKALVVFFSEKLTGIPIAENRLFDAVFEQEWDRTHHDLGGLQHDVVETFYFLHGCAAVDDGAVAGKYVLRYRDGSSAELELTGGANLAGSDRAEDLSAALSVEHGLYLATWDNPHPDRPVQSMDVIGMGKDDLVLLGITCKLARSNVHD